MRGSSAVPLGAVRLRRSRVVKAGSPRDEAAVAPRPPSPSAQFVLEFAGGCPVDDFEKFAGHAFLFARRPEAMSGRPVAVGIGFQLVVIVVQIAPIEARAVPADTLLRYRER